MRSHARGTGGVPINSNHVPKRKTSAGQLVRWRIGQLRTICANSADKRNRVAAQLLLHNIFSEQVVVTSPRIDFTNQMAEGLRASEIPHSRIDSTMPADGHARQAADFKGEKTRILLIGVRCALGYSFDQCPNIIIASPDWGYGTVNQAIGRVYRVTTKLPVNVAIYVCQNTIEEVMLDSLAMKESAANSVLFGEDPDDGADDIAPSAVLQQAAAKWRTASVSQIPSPQISP